MRHRYFGRKLNRDVKERKALFRSLIGSLILHDQVTTTIARAKAIRSLGEKLVTAAKDGSTSAVNKLSAFLVRRELIEKMQKDIAPRFSQKIGGYLRIIRIGRRPGDQAEEVIVSWTEPPLKVEKKEKDTKRGDKKPEKAKAGKSRETRKGRARKNR